MSNNKYIETDSDLQEMKSQYAYFKERLDNQPILTPTLIETAIKSKVKSVNSVIRNFTFVAGPVIVLMLAGCVYLKFSWIFTIITGILLAAAIIADNFMVWPLRKLFAPNTSLLEAAAIVAKSRRRLAARFVTGVIILIPFLAWFEWEILNSPVVCSIYTDFNLTLLIVSQAIGVIIGLIIGTKIMLKLRRNLSEIDKNIKECLSDAEDN